MTLVYARKFPEGSYILSDTGYVIPMLGTRNNPFESPGLKIFSVPNVGVIAFSGNTTYLAELKTGGMKSIQQMCDEAHKLHLRSGEEIDFILMDNDGTTLLKISHGKVEDVQTCYIGSNKAFNSFQEERYVGPKFLENRIFTSRVYGLGGTSYSEDLRDFYSLMGSDVDQVRGVVVSWISSPSYFGYSDYYTAQGESIKNKSSEDKLLSVRSEYNGHFILTCSGVGERGFAYFLPQSNIGGLLSPYERKGLSLRVSSTEQFFESVALKLKRDFSYIVPDLSTGGLSFQSKLTRYSTNEAETPALGSRP